MPNNKKAREELCYRETRILQMLGEHGGAETAKKLVSRDRGTEGFTVLWEYKRLDLSVESLVLKEEYQTLFSDDIRQICRDRLKDYGFEIK